MVGFKKPAKLAKPKRNVIKVLSNVRQVVKIEHIPEPDAVWAWGKADCEFLPQKGLKICVWNIWKQSGGQQFLKEFQKVIDGSDLIMCQEALLAPNAFEIFAPSGFEAIHAATYRRLDGARDGVLTMSRVQSLMEGIRIISTTAEPFVKTTKAALITFYKTDNEIGKNSLAIVNIHSTLLRRPKTAGSEIRRILEFLENHNGPMIFAGDFNTFTPAYFQEMATALYELGFKHADIVDDPRIKLARLDQVFYKGILLKSVNVDVSYKHSDHFPIFCEFVL